MYGGAIDVTSSNLNVGILNVFVYCVVIQVLLFSPDSAYGLIVVLQRWCHEPSLHLALINPFDTRNLVFVDVTLV